MKRVGKMKAAMIVALLGMASAAVPAPAGWSALTAKAVEWKGIFYTPDASYKWSAEKKNGNYADATMKIVLIPAPAPPTGRGLDNADAAAVVALNTTCVNVQDGGTLTAMEGRCYNLVFDQNKDKSEYTITPAGAPKRSIAFYCQHLPTEFEDKQHYLKDASGADVEPVAQYPEGGHSHCHGDGCTDFTGFCVCKAKKNNWKLDCTNKAAVTAAITYLDVTANGCKKPVNASTGWKPTGSACGKNYYILQAHHDHCLHDQIPTGAENKLHYYENSYEDCFIKRQFNQALPLCTVVACATSQGQAAITAAVAVLQNPANNCGSEKLKTSNATQFNDSNCAIPACAGAIKTVLMAHDTCLESQLPNNLETALHDYEEKCEAQLCNSARKNFNAYDQACSTDAESPASKFGSQVAFLVTALLLVMQL